MQGNFKYILLANIDIIACNQRTTGSACAYILQGLATNGNYWP
jgi:hypothetical protein